MGKWRLKSRDRNKKKSILNRKGLKSYSVGK